MSSQFPFTVMTLDPETQKSQAKMVGNFFAGLLGLLLLSVTLLFVIHVFFGYRFEAVIRPDSQGLYKYNFRSGETFYCSAEMQDGKLVTGHCEPLPEKGAGKSQ